MMAWNNTYLNRPVAGRHLPAAGRQLARHLMLYLGIVIPEPFRPCGSARAARFGRERRCASRTPASRCSLTRTRRFPPIWRTSVPRPDNPAIDGLAWRSSMQGRARRRRRAVADGGRGWFSTVQASPPRSSIAVQDGDRRGIETATPSHPAGSPSPSAVSMRGYLPPYGKHAGAGGRRDRVRRADVVSWRLIEPGRCRPARPRGRRSVRHAGFDCSRRRPATPGFSTTCGSSTHQRWQPSRCGAPFGPAYRRDSPGRRRRVLAAWTLPRRRTRWRTWRRSISGPGGSTRRRRRPCRSRPGAGPCLRRLR